MSTLKSQINSLPAGRGRDFIWAHSLMMSMDFDSQIGWFDWNKISSVTRLLRYDARGHGLSHPAASAEGYRWDRLGEDMIALADEYSVEKFIAGGQSMGCATALFAALFAPERVAGLVLATPPTAWESRAAQCRLYRSMADRIKRKGIGAMAQLMSLNPAMPEWMYNSHPEKSELAVQTVRRYHIDTLANVLVGAGLSNLPETARLASLQMPTLILAWEGDQGHPIDTSSRLAEAIPNSELVVAYNLEEFATWTERVTTFVEKL